MAKHWTALGLPGDPVGLPCPKAGHCGGQIVYNGNYFCSEFQYPLTDGCDWALSSGDNGEPVGRRDKNVWRKIQATDWFKEATRDRDRRG